MTRVGAYCTLHAVDKLMTNCKQGRLFMKDSRPTKLIRIYQQNDNGLLAIRKKLEDQWKRTATYADVVNFLLDFHILNAINEEQVIDDT